MCRKSSSEDATAWCRKSLTPGRRTGPRTVDSPLGASIQADFTALGGALRDKSESLGHATQKPCASVGTSLERSSVARLLVQSWLKRG